jgi:hypothetical protein
MCRCRKIFNITHSGEVNAMAGWVPLISLVVLIGWVMTVIAIFQMHSHTREMTRTLKEILAVLNKRAQE